MKFPITLNKFYFHGNSHLPGRVISGIWNQFFPSLSLNHQDSSAIWHLNNRLVLFEKIRLLFFLYFSYGETSIHLNLQNVDQFYIIRSLYSQQDIYKWINKEKYYNLDNKRIRFPLLFSYNKCESKIFSFKFTWIARSCMATNSTELVYRMN